MDWRGTIGNLPSAKATRDRRRRAAQVSREVLEEQHQGGGPEVRGLGHTVSP